MRPNRQSDAWKQAYKLREKFMDREPEWEIDIPWEWPKAMIEVGTCESVMYASDKWRSKGDREDYKHISEGPQWLWVQPDFLVWYDIDEKVDAFGPKVRLPRMPSTFAILADVLAIQSQLYEERDERGGYHLSNGQSEEEGEGFVQIDIPKAKLGAAQLQNGSAVLLLYTNDDLHAMVVGDELRIERDGIAG
jgi:hypothetical protein